MCFLDCLLPSKLDMFARRLMVARCFFQTLEERRDIFSMAHVTNPSDHTAVQPSK